MTTDWFVGNPPFQIDAKLRIHCCCPEMLISQNQDLYAYCLRLHRLAKGHIKGMEPRCAVQLILNGIFKNKIINFNIKPVKEMNIDIEIPMGFLEIHCKSCDILSVKKNRYVNVKLYKDKISTLKFSI